MPGISRLKTNAPHKAGRFDATGCVCFYTQPVGFGVPA